MPTGESLANEIALHKKGRVPRALRHAQLLDIAEELFLERGYEQSSIEDICRRAGISRPVIYDLFGSKAGIYIAAVRRAREVLERQIAEAAATTTDPREQMARGADAYFALIENDPRRWELLFGRTGLIGDLAEEFAAERRRTVDVIAALLTLNAPNAGPERISAYAHLISGAGEQLGRAWLADRQLTREQVVTYYTDFVWDGARPLIDGAGAR